MKRRDFLRRSLGGGAALLLPAGSLGCESGERAVDAGGRVDAFAPDAGPPPVPRGLSKGPWVQLLSPGRARLRFESRIEEPFAVRIERPAGDDAPEPTLRPMELTYQRDALMMERYFPDEPGLHVVQEVVLEDLAPGEELRWTVTPPEGEPATGGFRAPVAPDRGFRFGWLSDTSFPHALPGIGVLDAQEPDLVLHGGDITYQANPFDTWNGMANGMAPLFRRAPVHFCVGNHEFENQDEISVQFERLFAGQGDEGGDGRWFAYTYGGVRFVHVDTESGRLLEMADSQIAFLERELAAASADPDIHFPIVSFHRPTYTFSKHAPGDGGLEVRAYLHGLFLEHGVPLVLAGHAHAYERFLVDGVCYVVDGCGGAITYDPDEERDLIASQRPEEIALRQAVHRSHGVTTVDVGGDGGLSLTHYAAEDGAVVDTASIAAPG